MKTKIFAVALCTSLLLLAATPTHAQTASATATPKANQDLDELKERLATKVAQLRDVVRKAVYGTVKTISISSATVETKTKDIKIELSDDIIVTQILSGKRTDLTIEDVAADDPVTIFGTYDSTLDLLKAKVIFIESTKVFERVSGKVTEIDREGFTLTLQTKEGRSVIVDIEKATKTNGWSAADGLVKAGFSKVLVGDTVHVYGTPVAKAENRISALRILDIGNLSGVTPPTTIAPTATASSPSATVKPTTKPSTAKPSATPTP